jgi:hypothetical protein
LREKEWALIEPKPNQAELRNHQGEKIRETRSAEGLLASAFDD